VIVKHYTGYDTYICSCSAVGYIPEGDDPEEYACHKCRKQVTKESIVQGHNKEYVIKEEDLQ